MIGAKLISKLKRPSTITVPDLEADINTVFRELRCDSTQETPHGGDITGWITAHSCAAGWICHDHYDRYITQLWPENIRLLYIDGVVACPVCHQHFTNLNDFATIHPIDAP